MASIQRIPRQNGTGLEASSLRKCLSKGRCSRGQISRHSSRLDYYANPSAMQATGKASGPGQAHNQEVGAPTGRMTARPTTKQARKNVFAVDGRCRIISENLESRPHCIQGTLATNSGNAHSLPSEPRPNQYQSLRPKYALCLSLAIQRRKIID